MKKHNRETSLLQNPAVVGVLASLLSIVIGLALGFVLLVLLNPAASLEGMKAMMTTGFGSMDKFGKVLYQAAPLMMCGLSVGFAFKTGLFNIGASGQYTMGAFFALLFAIQFQMPWFVCLLASAVGGAIWGIFPGLFKAYFNVNEVITAIMFNWIGMYLVNLILANSPTMLASGWGASNSDRTAALSAANTGAMYEQLGAAGLQIDDKVLPASHPARDEIIDWELMGPKIHAIRDNVSPDFVIVFRTCANLYGYGIDEAIRRINLSKECGADYAYVDGIKSMEELEKVSQQATIPLMVNLNEKGFVGGNVPIEQVKSLNFSIGLFPISSMLAASQGMIEVLGALADQGSTLSVRDKMTDPPTRIHRMMGQVSLVEKYTPYYSVP